MAPRRRLLALLRIVCLVLLVALAAPRPAAAYPVVVRAPLRSPAILELPRGQAGVPRFERFTIADGLPNGTVRALLQDRQGYLWIGTEGGLARYDGYDFVVYQHDPGDDTTLAHDTIWALYEDAEGALWIGTTAGLDRFDRATGTFVHYPTYLEGAAVLALQEDPLGTLWVGLEGWGLARLERERQMVGLVFPPSGAVESRRTSGGSVLALYRDRRGNLWVGTESGLDRLDPAAEGLVHYVHDPANPASLGASAIGAITEDGQGMLWVSTYMGLDRFDPQTQTVVHYRNDPNDPGSLGDDRTLTLGTWQAGRLWIGTMDGLEQFVPAEQRFLHYRHDPTDPASLSADIVLSVYEDRSGVLWVGTFEGLNKYSPTNSRFTLYQSSQDVAGSLSANIVTALYEDRRGWLWAGTFDGALNLLDRAEGRFTVYAPDPASTGAYITVMAEGSAGVLWMVRTNGWLEQFDPQTGLFQPFRNVSTSGGGQTLAVDAAGNLWVGTMQGLLYLDPVAGTEAVYRRVENPFSPCVVDAIRLDQAGRLWVAVQGQGLYTWEEGQTQLTPYPGGARGDTIQPIYQDARGILWLGKFRDGLERLDPATGAVSLYGLAQGLAGLDVRCITADATGALWLTTDQGISRFDPLAATFRNLDTYDGLPGGGFYSCRRSATGELFFGGVNGLVAIDPGRIEDNPYPPPVVVTAILKSNRRLPGEVQPGQRLQVAYNDNFISFDYAALDYHAPGKNEYAYRMEGLDPDWVAAGTRRHADYPNLPPGEYVFRVRAANNDGLWNEEGAAVYVAVAAPFWARWWFRGLVILVLAGGIVAAYALRVRGIRARNRELEAQVESRTQELTALYAAEQRRAEQFKVLAEVGRQLTSLLDIDQVLTQVARLVQGAFGYYHVGIGLVEGDEVVYRVGAGVLWDDPHFTFRPARLKVGTEGITGAVAASGEAMVVPDVSQEPRYVWMQGSAARSECVLPLISKGQVIGVLDVQSDRLDAFDATDLAVLQSLAHQAGAAIENARLYGQAQEVAVVAERNRLARDLHDSVTQSLYSLTLMAEAGRRLLAARELAQAEETQARVGEIALQALQEMRLFVFELRPLALEQGGVVGALEQRLEAVERRAGVQARLIVEGDCSAPLDVQEELYHIAQEALNNMLKHAHASAVTVKVSMRDGDLALNIQDNGVGFDPAAPGGRGGMGLRNMRERARRIGGELTIRSAPGEGTIVQLMLRRVSPAADAEGQDWPCRPEDSS